MTPLEKVNLFWKNVYHGEVTELAESGTLLMCCLGNTGPRVRIPPSPPSLAEAFAKAGARQV